MLDLVPEISNFGRGPGPQSFPFQDLNLGLQVCYEGLFPDFSRQLADQGSQIFINLTNDSWFGTWAEPLQHLYMTFGRAIEFRRPLVRITNTGISTAITASGKIQEFTASNTEAIQLVQIPYHEKPTKTLFARYGQNIPYVLFLMLVGLLFSFSQTKPKNEQEKTGDKHV